MAGPALLQRWGVQAAMYHDILNGRPAAELGSDCAAWLVDGKRD